MADNPKKDRWDKTKLSVDIVKVVVEIILICVMSIAGYFINTTLKARELNLKNNELQLKYIEIAVGILQAEPDSRIDALREWAADIIDSNPEYPLTEAAKKQLLQNAMPSKWDDSARWNDEAVWKDEEN